MLRPRFTNVQFHPAYTIETDSQTRVFGPSMTALDDEDRVWRTWQDAEGNWAAWYTVAKYVDPFVTQAGAS